MKKLWIITIAFFAALCCFSGCSHTDDYGTQSNVSNTAQTSQEDGSDTTSNSDSSNSSDSGEEDSIDTSSGSDGDSSSTGSEEEGDVVPPITNGGNFDGTV